MHSPANIQPKTRQIHSRLLLRSTKYTHTSSYSVAIPIEYPQEKALLPLNKCPTRIHPETKSVGESKEINRLHAQPAKSHPTNVAPTLQSAYYLLLIAPTDTTQKEEQNNSYTKRVGKRYQLPPTTLCYNVPSARTRADQHK